MGRLQKNKQSLTASALWNRHAVFLKHGVENVSIADLMKAAGLTPGGFFKQFESKEALVTEASTLAFEQSKDVWNLIPGHAAGRLLLPR
jgi:TetR/AcrR family transcriptional repressor of nem operon